MNLCFCHKRNKEFFLIVLLVASAAIINIKYIFVDFGIDASFQTTMAYRLAIGDKLFCEMWEPYQTSAFLCAFFVKIYLAICGTTTGIVIYLQVIGVLIDVFVSVCLYRTVKYVSNNSKIALITAWLFLVISPKDVPIAEYTNMLVWFSTLSFCMIIFYWERANWIFLVLSAVFICGMVLAYPSAVIIFVLLLLYFLYKKDYKAAGIVSLVCVTLGMIFILWVFSICPPKELVNTIRNILSLESSHSETVYSKIIRYSKELFSIGVMNTIAYLVGIAAFFVTKEKRSEKQSLVLVAYSIYFIIILAISFYMAIAWEKYVRFDFFNYFIPIIVIGLLCARLLDAKEKEYYYMGLIFGIGDFISALLFTNLRLADTIPLSVLAMLISFVPMKKAFDGAQKNAFMKRIEKIILITFCLVVAFRSIYIIRPLNGNINTIFSVRGVAKRGPDRGIVSEYIGPYIQNETYLEWEQYINEGDAVFIIGGSLDNIGYLYKKVEISAPSTVPTPDYNETLLEYWKQNPEKYPDVIVASCWYGETNSILTDDSFIMKWIYEEFVPSKVIDGKYWRYYYR